MYEDNNGNNNVNGPSYGTYNGSYGNQFGLSDNSNAVNASPASDGMASVASGAATETAAAAPAATNTTADSSVSAGSALGNPSSPFAYTYDSQSGVSGSAYGSQGAATGSTYGSQAATAGSAYASQSAVAGNTYSSQNTAGNAYGAQSATAGSAYSSQNTVAGSSYGSPAAATGSSFSSFSSQRTSSGSSYGAQGAVSAGYYGAQGTSSGNSYGSHVGGSGNAYGSQSASTGPVYSYSTQNSPYSSNSYASSQYTQPNMGSNGQSQPGAKPKKKKSPVGVILLASALFVLCILIIGGVSIARLIGSHSDFSAKIETNKFDSDDPIFDDKDAEAVPEDFDISDNDDKDDDTDSKDKADVSSGADEADMADNHSGLTTKTVVSDVSSMVEDVMPSMVAITNHMTVDYYYYQEQGDASGSGIIIGKNDHELLIATNYHVVADNDGLEVNFIDDAKVTANVKGADEQMDLAVVAVNISDIPDDTMDRIEIATMGDSDNLKIGEPAIAIGNSLGYGLSVTTGVISAVNREVYSEGEQGAGSAVKGFIQTDAAINPGNSGGALLNINGEVIGINSNKIGGSNVEGMGYAIPISAAEPILGDLMSKVTKVSVPEDERGYLGISGATVTPSEIEYYGLPEGVYIATVNGGSPAADVGLQKGDFVVAVNGEKVDSMGDLQKELSYYRAGDEIEISVKRPDGDDYTEQTYKVKLGDKGVLDG